MTIVTTVIVRKGRKTEDGGQIWKVKRVTILGGNGRKGKYMNRVIIKILRKK